MKARKYINRIEVWGIPEVLDGFGGDTYGEPIKITESWCNIKTITGRGSGIAGITPERLSDLGLLEFKYGIQLNLRKRSDLNYFQPDIYFVYQGVDYMTQSIVEVDLKGFEIQIIATAR
jgi:hypothetical protein